jgi:fumarylacetoacetate (FAA) hydrolase family protein
MTAAQGNLAIAGIQGLVGISAAFDAKRVASANAEAARILQAANNRLEGARASAYARVQAEVTAISQTRSRLADASQQGNIRQQVVASEQLGALSVAAAAAGQGGASVRMAKQAMLRTVAETAARRQVAEARQIDDLTGQQGDAIYNAVVGQDYSYNPASMDYTAHMKPNNAGIWNAALNAATGATKAYAELPGTSAKAQPSTVSSYDQRGAAIDNAFKFNLSTPSVRIP